MSFRNLILAMALGLGLQALHAIPNPDSESQLSKPRTLDTVSIRKAYLEGDFEEAIEQIESAMRLGGPFSHADSVFIFKHLGVMYTAKYETREKGKSYLVKLIHVDPGARIVDMYASDMIYMIFKSICDEYDLYQSKRVNSVNHATGGTAGTPGENGSASGRASAPGRRRAWLGWTVGTLAAAGSIALFIFLTAEDGSTKENVVP